MVTGLSRPLDHNVPFDFESDNETTKVEIDFELSKQEKLVRAIDKEMNSKISCKPHSFRTIEINVLIKKIEICLSVSFVFTQLAWQVYK
jgi:hypothetical protein